MSEVLDDIKVPVFGKGEDGFSALLKAIEPKQVEEAFDPEMTKQTLVAAKPIYQKADAAQVTAEKALAAVEAIEKANKDKAEAEAKAAEEADKSAKQKEQAREFDEMNSAFGKAMGTATSLSELFKHAGYDELSKKQVEGVDFPITYDEVIAKTISTGAYDKAAVIMKGMYEILNPSASASKTVNPTTSGGSAQQAPKNAYLDDLTQINKRYQNKFDFDSISKKNSEISGLRAKYGVKV